MSITENINAFVNDTSVSIGLSQMFTVTAGASNPTYLGLTALDRSEYTAGATSAIDSLSGNAPTLKFRSIGGAGRRLGVCASGPLVSL